MEDAKNWILKNILFLDPGSLGSADDKDHDQDGARKKDAKNGAKDDDLVLPSTFFAQTPVVVRTGMKEAPFLLMFGVSPKRIILLDPDDRTRMHGAILMSTVAEAHVVSERQIDLFLRNANPSYVRELAAAPAVWTGGTQANVAAARGNLQLVSLKFSYTSDTDRIAAGLSQQFSIKVTDPRKDQMSKPKTGRLPASKGLDVPLSNNRIYMKGNGVADEILSLSVIPANPTLYWATQIEDLTTLMPFKSVSWYISLHPGGKSTESQGEGAASLSFRKDVYVEGTKGLTLTNQMIGHYFRIDAEFDESLIGEDFGDTSVVNGRFTVYYGPVIPSSKICKLLLTNLSYGHRRFDGETTCLEILKIYKLIPKDRIIEATVSEKQKLPNAPLGISNELCTEFLRTKVDPDYLFRTQVVLTNEDIRFFARHPSFVFPTLSFAFNEILPLNARFFDKKGRSTYGVYDRRGAHMCFAVIDPETASFSEPWQIYFGEPEIANQIYCQMWYNILNKAQIDIRGLEEWRWDALSGYAEALQEKFREGFLDFDWNDLGRLLKTPSLSRNFWTYQETVQKEPPKAVPKRKVAKVRKQQSAVPLDKAVDNQHPTYEFGSKAPKRFEREDITSSESELSESDEEGEPKVRGRTK